MVPFIIACLVVAIAFATAAAGVIFLLQRRLIFHPDDRRPAPSLGIAGLRVIPADAQNRLAAMVWFVPAFHGLPTVVFLHGNAGNIGDREDRMAAFAQDGLGILMVEYPGYGGEPGTPSEKGLLEAGRRALEFLDRNNVSSPSVFLYGESIGTGIATRLATEREVGGLILESPYTSILDIACQMVPWLPVRLLLLDHFEQLSLIAMVHAPLLVLQGALDRIVPPAMGQAVFAAANQPKRLWVALQGGHNDLAAFGAIEEAVAFVREAAWPAGQVAGKTRVAAEKEATSPLRDTARRAQILAKALQDELVRRHRIPEGLGGGNGPGVDVTGLLTAALPEGSTLEAVTETLTAAGFSVVRMTARDGQPVLTATRDMDAQWFSKTYVMAIAMLRQNRSGEEEVASLSASLMWSAL